MSTLIANYDGNFSGRAITLRLEVWLESQNVNNNTSRVAWTLRAFEYQSETAWSNNTSNWHVDIGGQHWYGNWTYNFGANDNIILATGWRDISHNADGTANFWTGADAQAAGLVGNAVNGGQTYLPTIPRSSTPTFATDPIYADQTQTIFTNRASTSFLHTVKYTIGSATGTIATNVSDSVAWKVPLSLLSQFPNSFYGVVWIDLETWNGGTYIGTVRKGFTIYTPASAGPSFTAVTATEATAGVAANIGAFVQNISRANMAITGAAGQYGATITAYKIVVNGQTFSTATGTTGLLSTSGTMTATATITDSRGLTATKTGSWNVLAYAPPTVNSVTLERALATGVVAPDSGTYLRVSINATSVSLLNTTQRNSLNYKISSRLRGTTTWTLKKTFTVANSGLSFNSFDLVSPYPILEAHDVLVEVYDDFSTVPVQGTLATAAVFMHWGNKDQGLGVGKFWERGAVDALGAMYQNNGLAVLDTGYFAATTDTSAGTSAVKAVTPASLATRFPVQPTVALTLVNGFTTAGFGANAINAVEVVNGVANITLTVNQPSNGAWAANTVIGTLPAGYRPRRRQYIMGAKVETWIETDGRIILNAAVTAGNGFIAFSWTYSVA
jgi:hypothetical protein